VAKREAKQFCIVNSTKKQPSALATLLVQLQKRCHCQIGLSNVYPRDADGGAGPTHKESRVKAVRNREKEH